MQKAAFHMAIHRLLLRNQPLFIMQTAIFFNHKTMVFHIISAEIIAHYRIWVS